MRELVRPACLFVSVYHFNNILPQRTRVTTVFVAVFSGGCCQQKAQACQIIPVALTSTLQHRCDGSVQNALL
jgi:hypothetical protein